MPIFISWVLPTVDTNGSTLVDANLVSDYRDTDNRSISGTLATSITVEEGAYGREFSAFVTGRDANANYDPTDEMSTTCRVNRPPVISISQVNIPSTYAQSSVTIDYTVTDEAEATDDPTVDLVTLIGGWSIDKENEEITLQRPSGGWGSIGTSYNNVLTATDEWEATDSAQVIVNVADPENQPPVPANNVVFEIVFGETGRFDLDSNFSDAESDPLTFTGVFQGSEIEVVTETTPTDDIYISGDSLVIDSGALGLAVGEYAISITASDGELTGTGLWTVKIVPPPPRLDLGGITISLSPLP